MTLLPAKVMFLLVSVILLTGGWSGVVSLSACWDTTTPTPEACTLLGSRPPGKACTLRKHAPLPEAYPPPAYGMSGRYASYWNAFLFY